MSCLTFPDHCFNFVMKKLKKTKKNAVFKCSEHSFLIQGLLENHFLKTRKCYFQIPTIIVLELKEALKPISKRVPINKFQFKMTFSSKIFTEIFFYQNKQALYHSQTVAEFQDKVT